MPVSYTHLYDPLFIPDEYGAPDGKHPNTDRRSYAQLTPAEKDAISPVSYTHLPECRNAHPLVKDTGGLCPLDRCV